EEAFITDLEHHAQTETLDVPTRQALTSRHLATAVVTALRDGAWFHDMHRTAPHLLASELVNAYRELEEKIHTAVNAWDRIVATGDINIFHTLSTQAGTLMPFGVNILRSVHDAHTFPHMAEDLGQHVQQFGGAAGRVASAMRAGMDPDERKALNNQLLGGDMAMRNGPLMLPRRVGELSPARLALLLGEVR